MRPVMFHEQDVVLGVPKDWDMERDGPCTGLPVKFTNGACESHWRPSAGELARLNAGGHVVLHVLMPGVRTQPPVAIGVELP